MQGRLLPPREGRIQAFPAGGWEREMALAAEAGIDGIEWIYEVQGEERNPLRSDAGAARMEELQREHGIKVESLCADWFMDRPLLAVDGPERERRVERLRWLLDRASATGISRVVLPLVDASALRDDDVEALAALARSLAPDLEAAGVELHLETSLPALEFAKLLDRIDHPQVMANYDTGNSASLGYDPREEFDAYGERIGSVHVKDRVRGGGTAPLGEGDADLELVLARLRERGWDRPLVLQVARGAEGEEVAKTRADAELVRGLWEGSAG